MKATEENNKKIAEFMGMTYEKNIGWYDNEMMLEQIVYDLNDGNCFDELEFHTSWDWLMPVVEKIESMRDDFGNAHRVTIDMGNAVIENTSNNSSISIAILGRTKKIDATYNAVVDFINEYNKNK